MLWLNGLIERRGKAAMGGYRDAVIKMNPILVLPVLEPDLDTSEDAMPYRT